MFLHNTNNESIINARLTVPRAWFYHLKAMQIGRESYDIVSNSTK